MSKQNYYCLNKKIDEEWTPKIKKYIEEMAQHEVDPLNLTGVGCLNPARVRDILTDKLGYNEDETKTDFNGWEWDYWFYFNHDTLPPVRMTGTGLTFELYIERAES